MEIQIDSLVKRYGSRVALNHISLTVEPGMFGLLGRNGAGKTTLMKILSTLARPDGGNVVMGGISLRETSMVRRMMGYLPQDFSFYPDLTVLETMKYLSSLSEVPSGLQKTRIPELLERVNLWEDRKKKIKALSGGMKRRLGIAQALLHDPDILIADEPTAGLDPEERLRFYDLLRQISKDKIVIVSTHIVADIEAACARVGVLDSGELLFCGSVKELAGFAERRRTGEDGSSMEGNTSRAVGFSGAGSAFVKGVAPTAEDGYMELLRKKEKGGVR